MSQSEKLTPNLDHTTTKVLNLTVLQRMDSFIEEILMTAAHVTFYEFNIESNQWSRKDVEGSLFVVKRNSQPRFQFIVMNRRSADNLVENLLGDFEFEIQNPYLLYRNANQEVNGIWFYNARECEEVASLFSRILNAYSKVPSKPQMSSNKSEFKELEAVPTMTVMEGPLEPSPTPSVARDICEDSALANFFNVLKYCAVGCKFGFNPDKKPDGVFNSPARDGPLSIHRSMESSAYYSENSIDRARRWMTMNMTPNASNRSNPRQSYHAPSNHPIASHAPIATPSPVPTLQLQSLPMSAANTSSSHQYDPPETIRSSNRIHNLLKPSSFLTPPTTRAIMMLPVSSFTPATLRPLTGLQHPHSHSPPTPPVSLTSSSLPTLTIVPVISRDKVRDALVMLAQDNDFIDMLYQALTKVQRL